MVKEYSSSKITTRGSPRIFINKNTYIIPTNAYVTYRSVKDTDNVSRHFFSTESTHVNPRGHLLEVISPL